MIILNLTKMAHYISQADGEGRSSMLNDLIEKAFDPETPELERNVRLSFNAHLFSVLRDQRVWPPRADA